MNNIKLQFQKIVSTTLLKSDAYSTLWYESAKSYLNKKSNLVILLGVSILTTILITLLTIRLMTHDLTLSEKVFFTIMVTAMSIFDIFFLTLLYDEVFKPNPPKSYSNMREYLGDYKGKIELEEKINKFPKKVKRQAVNNIPLQKNNELIVISTKYNFKDIIKLFNKRGYTKHSKFNPELFLHKFTSLNSSNDLTEIDYLNHKKNKFSKEDVEDFVLFLKFLKSKQVIDDKRDYSKISKIVCEFIPCNNYQFESVRNLITLKNNETLPKDIQSDLNYTLIQIEGKKTDK